MKVLIMLAALVAFVAATGEVNEVDLQLTSKEVAFATDAINKHFQQTEGANAATRTALQVVHATVQVVAGVKYGLTLRVNNGNSNELCQVSVWERVWLEHPNNYIAQDLSCTEEHVLGGDDHDYQPHGSNMIGGDDHDYKPHGKNMIGGDDHDYKPHGYGYGNNPSPRFGMLGGQTEVPMNDPEVQEALRTFVDSVNSMANNAYRSIPVGGTVTKQVVNGIIYRFKNVVFAETTCSNTNEENHGKLLAEECPFRGGNQARHTTMCGRVLWNRGNSNQGEYQFPAEVQPCN